VAMMLAGSGWEVINLGTGVTPAQFVDAVRTHRPDIVGMSALLTTTIPKMKLTIEALKEAGLRESVRVMVGGAPVTQAFADEIGADGYGANAGGAVDGAKRLLA
jgi:5-methyltetrahydrofolate--homocysteine methyltransferase